jgi:hypothetical protein
VAAGGARWARGWLTIDAAWAAVVLAGLFIVVEQRQIRPNDFWWHLRLGQLIVETGSIPSVEPFSFVIAGQEWLNQPWLAQVVLFATFEAGGATAILVLHAVTITSGYALILLAMRPRDYGRAGAIAVLVGATVGSMNWEVRPQSFSLLFFGALIYLIEHDRRAASSDDRAGVHRRLWLVVPLFMLWANVHGVFVYGVAALGIYIASRLIALGLDGLRGVATRAQGRDGATLAAIGLLALAALAVNALGPAGLVRYTLELAQQGPVARNLGEWRHLGLDGRDGVAVALSVVLLVALSWRRTRLLTADQWVTIALALALAIAVRRAAVWYGMVLIPPLATLLRARLPRATGPGYARLNAALIAAAVLAAAISFPAWRTALPRATPMIEAHTPVAATAALCAQLDDGARVFQDFAFASYQSWACPRLAVFVDPRLYPFAWGLWEDYIDVSAGREAAERGEAGRAGQAGEATEGWQSILDRHSITHLFLSRQTQPAAIAAAEQSPCWRSLYRDANAEIFARACPGRPGTVQRGGVQALIPSP